MATYKGIKGIKVQSLASDPPTATSIGQMWYNTTSGALKYSIEGGGSWASGTAVNNSSRSLGGVGTTTAALKMAGMYDLATTEQWNGTGWTEVGDLNQGRNTIVAFGTSVACIGASGYKTDDNATYNLAEEWDNSSWTAVATMNTARGYASGSNQGTTTSGIVFGGWGPSYSTPTGLTEDWNGTGWTEVGDLNTNRKNAIGGGTATAAYNATGGTPSYLANTEIYNGTAWTEVADVNTARTFPGGSGTITAALIYTGTTGSNQALTESYNGTAWTEVADTATALMRPATGMGSSTAALRVCGYTTTALTSVEEWSSPTLTVKTVTVS
jgi:hypothetical protein